MKLLRRTLLAALLVFAAIQLRGVPRTNPPVRGEVTAPADVAAILRKACYDCHSNETRWPWYARVAPVSWWLADHVREGRDELNFSEWNVLDRAERRMLLEDIDEQVARRTMPLRSYRLLHAPARLSEAERARLRSWARSQR